MTLLAQGRPRRIGRRRLGCVLLACLPVAFVINEWLVRPLLNPLRRSPWAIEHDLLEQKPLGTPRGEVEAWVTAQGWWPAGLIDTHNGELFIKRVMGEYESFGFTVLVLVEWVFRSDGRLERVEVHKWVADAP